jgi:site-specific DNA-methyltransferase (adenine-specific)
MAKIEITNEDNMVLMKRYPDKYFDLAIVDPPYGIGEADGRCRTRKKHNNKVKHTKKDWDIDRPSAEYWAELRRVSKNQIVWGANYFTEHLPPSMGWIFWNKQIGGDFSDGELAYTSFNRALKMVTKWNGNNGVARIHPTQKPIYLYEWILQNYATKGNKILDTHLGSGSIAIACDKNDFDLVACELDAEYYNKALKRLKMHQQQLTMF